MRTRKNMIITEYPKSPKETIIIDFYNIYCTFISYNKYKTFSQVSFSACIDVITNSYKDKNIIVVSKDIFEVSNECILEHTRKNFNLSYVIARDRHHCKSKNKERDDYMCILLNKFNTGNSVILTNDKYHNYPDIINDVKSLKIEWFSKGTIISKIFLKSDLDLNSGPLINFKPTRSNVLLKF
jgi:hypothetical protein